MSAVSVKTTNLNKGFTHGCLLVPLCMIVFSLLAWGTYDWYLKRNIIRSVEYWVNANGLGEVWTTDKVLKMQQHPRWRNQWNFTVKGKVKSYSALCAAIAAQGLPSYGIYLEFVKLVKPEHPEMTLQEYARRQLVDPQMLDPEYGHLMLNIAPCNQELVKIEFPSADEVYISGHWAYLVGEEPTAEELKAQMEE